MDYDFKAEVGCSSEEKNILLGGGEIVHVYCSLGK